MYREAFDRRHANEDPKGRWRVISHSFPSCFFLFTDYSPASHPTQSLRSLEILCTVELRTAPQTKGRYSKREPIRNGLSQYLPSHLPNQSHLALPVLRMITPHGHTSKPSHSAGFVHISFFRWGCMSHHRWVYTRFRTSFCIPNSTNCVLATEQHVYHIVPQFHRVYTLPKLLLDPTAYSLTLYHIYSHNHVGLRIRLHRVPLQTPSAVRRRARRIHHDAKLRAILTEVGFSSRQGHSRVPYRCDRQERRRLGEDVL